MGVALFWALNVPAQAPDTPITCPTLQVVNDVVCARPEWRQQLYSLESKYLSAVIGANIKDVQIAKSKWKGKYILCGLLVMNRREIDECLLKSFEDFATELLSLAPELVIDRTALFKAATDRVKSYELQARERRMICHRETAAAVDDNTSSAKDIAVVVAQKCRPTSIDVAEALINGVEVSIPMFNTGPSLEAIRSLRKDLSDPEDMIAFVLEQRLARRQANRVPPKPKPKPIQGRTGKLEV